MTERLTSGNARLDQILDGGLPANAVNLVVGMPGTGKTMLVQQFMFAAASEQRPGVYLTTVSEPFDKVVRYGQTLSFFDVSALGSRVFYEDLGQPLTRGGLPAVLEAIEGVIRRRQPGTIVIDSFRALRAYAEEEEFRRFLHEIAGRASAFPASHFWVGEYTEQDMSWAPEFAVADSIIAMSTENTGQRIRRELTVLKLRGSDFLSGRHAYRLGADGIEVFPRLADPGQQAKYELDPSRGSTGVAALDELLADGYRAGSSTLIAGPTGCGKTLMGLHFILNGVETGQPGIIASLQENYSQLERVANSFGWSLDVEGLEVTYTTPVDLYIDEWVYRLLEHAEAIGAKRILIDSLTDLSFAVADDVRYREYLYSLSQRCSVAGISLMMTLETSTLFGLQDIGAGAISHLADNVVLLHYEPHDGGGELSRSLTLLKSRATRHQPQTRTFRIGDDGIQLVD